MENPRPNQAPGQGGRDDPRPDRDDDNEVGTDPRRTREQENEREDSRRDRSSGQTPPKTA